MGMLVNGKWQECGQPVDDKGEFVRASAGFRNWVTADGSPGPSGTGGFQAQANRYHLYVSLACPWAHRTLVFRKLKRLEDVISVSVVAPHMLADGWEYAPAAQGTSDTVNGVRYHYELYTMAEPAYTGRVTVPVLWDRERNTIVNNESSEIIRMLNSAFAAFTDDDADYYPQRLRDEIDAINATVYENVNNGVYRCGFATSQSAYASAFERLFETLDMLEERLSKQRYLVQGVLTEADWRLFTTLIRFDAVYVGHFKTNLRRINDYPNLSNYLRDLYQLPGIADTVDMEHIKQHYYYSHDSINPSRIVPLGPALDFTSPHDRERFPEGLAQRQPQ
jgi:glutathionyl-hydroquinone reductase